MRKAIWAASAAAVALVSTAALATVTFDTTTGVGFVGKGDVQVALNMNNAAVQKAALKFTYSDAATYEVFCAKDFDANGPHEAYTMYKQFNRNRGVSGTVSYEPRSKNQINGFNLIGWDGSVSVDGDPTVCPGGFYADYDGAAAAGVTDGSNVLLVSSSDGGLKVNDVPLTITPTV